MDALRAHFESLGLVQVETFIASGNVIFESSTKNVAVLERKIEAHLLASLGYEVKTFIRTEVEVAEIARYQPFTAAQRRSAGALNIGLLAVPLDAAAMKALKALRTDIDDFEVRGRELFWLCKKKQSESKVSNVVFERALKVRATFRGVNTIAKLAAKYSPSSPAPYQPRRSS